MPAGKRDSEDIWITGGSNMELQVLINFTEYLETIKALKECGFSETDENGRQLVQAQIKEIYQAFQEESAYQKTTTTELLNAVSTQNKNLFRSKAGAWIQYYESKTALFLMKQMIAGVRLTRDHAGKIVEFYEEVGIDCKSKATALYLAAVSQSSDDPLFSYYYSLLAFQTYPQLGEVFGLKYVYNPDQLYEEYHDKCPVCQNEESTPFHCVQQILVIGENQKFSPVKLWTKCDHCQTIYAYNFPVNIIGEINGHYTVSNEKKIITPRYPLRIYGDIFNKCRQITKGRRYLEVGVGNGEMLACALEMGFQADAVEICKEDCENISGALGVEVKWCDFLEFETSKEYDVIIMGDVLEHVSQPLKALQKAYDLLAFGGCFWVSTPNYNSSYSRLVKFDDAMWNQKNHITYFSYESLEPVLEEAGFEVVHYDISNRYNGSMELFCRKKAETIISRQDRY